jgi:hypothetical protein
MRYALRFLYAVPLLAACVWMFTPSGTVKERVALAQNLKFEPLQIAPEYGLPTQPVACSVTAENQWETVLKIKCNGLAADDASILAQRLFSKDETLLNRLRSAGFAEVVFTGGKEQWSMEVLKVDWWNVGNLSR